MYKVLALDLETSDLNPWTNEIYLIAYAYDDGPVEQIKIYDGEKPNELFLSVLSDSSVIKLGHNIRFDLLCLRAHGYTVNGIIDDTRVLAYLENPEQELGLKTLVENKFKRTVTRMEDFGKVRVKKAEKELYPVHCGKVWTAKEPLEIYNKVDVEIVRKLRKELPVTKWYREVEQPLSKILFDTETRGIQLDIPYLKRLENEFTERLKELSQAIGANECFNPNSPKQVQEKFKEQGISLASTDKHNLKLLSWGGNLFARSLMEYRQLSKLLGTYVKPLIEQSDSMGRIHGRFNQAGRQSAIAGDTKGTATGRLSSSEPNLQNIPDRTEEGKKIRRAFIASPGHVLIDSDLKQIEPRLIAHYSQSKVLLNAYEKGHDTHLIMASLIFGKSPEKCTKIERFIGKTSWLATVYGCWYKKLRHIVEVTSDEPVFYDDEFYRKVQAAFWQSNPEIAAWRQRHISATRHTAFVETLGGRSIRIGGICSHNLYERNEAERKAINFLVQGSAADIMKLIVIQLSMTQPIKLLATIHDEVLLETTNHLIDEKFVTSMMCNTVKLKNVPIEADTKVINSWADK